MGPWPRVRCARAGAARVRGPQARGARVRSPRGGPPRAGSARVWPAVALRARRSPRAGPAAAWGRTPGVGTRGGSHARGPLLRGARVGSRHAGWDARAGPAGAGRVRRESPRGADPHVRGPQVQGSAHGEPPRGVRARRESPRRVFLRAGCARARRGAGLRPPLLWSCRAVHSTLLAPGGVRTPHFCGDHTTAIKVLRNLCLRPLFSNLPVTPLSEVGGYFGTFGPTCLSGLGAHSCGARRLGGCALVAGGALLWLAAVGRTLDGGDARAGVHSCSVWRRPARSMGETRDGRSHVRPRGHSLGPSTRAALPASGPGGAPPRVWSRGPKCGPSGAHVLIFPLLSHR